MLVSTFALAGVDFGWLMSGFCQLYQSIHPGSPEWRNNPKSWRRMVFSMIFRISIFFKWFLGAASPAVHLQGFSFFPTCFFHNKFPAAEAGVLIFMKLLLELLPCHSGSRPFWRGEGIFFPRDLCFFFSCNFAWERSIWWEEIMDFFPNKNCRKILVVLCPKVIRGKRSYYVFYWEN